MEFTEAAADNRHQFAVTRKTAHGEMPQIADVVDTTTTMTTTSPLVGLVSGCAGAVALVYVGQPLDTVKVRMQLSTATHTSSSSSVSMWGCVRDMWRQASVAPASQHGRPNNTTALVGGGLHVGACSLPYATAGSVGKIAAARRMTRLMYAGTAPALMANVAENGVLFAAYGPCQRLVAFTIGLFDGSGGVDVEKKLGPAGMATAGSLASFCSAFALCPTELIKVRLQAADLERSNGAASGKSPIPASSALQVVARVWKTEGGLRGMYRGMGSTVAREMPGYYVFFLAYEASRTFLNEWHHGTAGTTAMKTKAVAASAGHGGNAADPSWVTMVAGAAAGIGLWLFVYPVDAIKSRIQASGGGGGADTSVNGSFLKTLVQSVRNEGPLALYRGLAPTLLRTVPASAIMFWTVERTTTLLSGYGL
ncbi:Mitochondrial carrier domain,Mitochondrial substrate/solute carrier [Cinara cedri]|uniref:Mitochondrial carrier domain,Mitochondrial substrate/solute carrier n=1 Tax=Cinara cedri TaxID=506608 RepID=A0A5E4MYQ8_9HEMI|nr:Mitochondrial carrier domain,Mitochondrial substrate/solute carrier [Cinara cedri]